MKAWLGFALLGLAIRAMGAASPALAEISGPFPRPGQSQLEQPLSGITILINPGHGGPETGAAGPTGYWAKDVSLAVSQLLRDQLVLKGAVVVMTRDDDRDVELSERQAMIERHQPAIALTIHYTAVEEDGDAETSQGIRTHWFHSQAHGPARFLHNHLVSQLGRPSQGLFWNNLALTRPSAAPSVVLELGFMTHPEEFEWIADPDQQQALARGLAEGIRQWFQAQGFQAQGFQAQGFQAQAMDSAN